jgi:transaldolase
MVHSASDAHPESVIERLLKTSPGLEVWWDSSPLVYPAWMEKMIANAPDGRKESLSKELLRLFDPEKPENTLFRGVTTNPPLSLAAMQNDPQRWSSWIQDYATTHPGCSVEDAYWALYKEIVRLGAQAFAPVFEKSGYLYGYLSGQVDPRRFFDDETMLKQALDLSTLAPNVMVKIPGTSQGLPIIRELTRRGISTNCTAAYTVPQFVQVAEAVQAGLLEARANGVNLTRWRSVITYMSTRWENAAEFEAEARVAGVELTPELRRLAGVAIFKKAHQIIRSRAYPSKMLICSVRLGPVVNGEMRCWHLEETAGADAVFTLPPNYLTELFTQANDLEFEPRIWKPIPAEALEQLNKIPYFVRSSQPDGWSVEEFNTLPPLQSTFKEFSGATEKMVAFVAERMPPAV